MAGVIIAFKNINLKEGILNSPWCGFNNFKYLFATKDAFVITRNTILYNLAFIVFGTIFSITLALFLSELKSKKMSKFYQTVVLFPYLVSMIIVSYLVYAFLSENTGMHGIQRQNIGRLFWYLSASGKAVAIIALFIYLRF